MTQVKTRKQRVMFTVEQKLDYKKPMDVYQESIKLNQNKKKAS